MGWLGWGFEETLWADVNAILVGYRGRYKMIMFLRGDSLGVPTTAQANPEQDGRPPHVGKARVLTPEAFDAMFGNGQPGGRRR